MNKPIDSEKLLKWIDESLFDISKEEDHSGLEDITRDIRIASLKKFKDIILSLQSQEKGEREFSLEDMENCFNAAQEQHPDNKLRAKYTSFDDYNGGIKPSKPKMTIEECKDKVVMDNRDLTECCDLYANEIVKLKEDKQRLLQIISGLEQQIRPK